MDGMHKAPSGLPRKAGVSYKPRYLEDMLVSPGPVSWVEIHAENYMVDGGPGIAGLRRVVERFPVSCHGVGLSIGSEGPLDAEHLDRLAHLASWLQPASVSEHLAWSGHGGAYFADLLPLPYDEATLRRVCDHMDEVQERLGRSILLENPANYLGFSYSSMAEVEFLAAIAVHTGCGLLLDINNVHVSAVNGACDAEAYLDAFPLALVGEIHLAGHEAETDEHGGPLLIDAHNNPVADPVWALFARLLARSGPLPVLIEWDNDLPEWPVLAAEAARADTMLVGCYA
ncbi:MAG: DUF692 domain-containing protein [Alphaproteobacteria bacterium]|nr:DUF692 domain-containing protein [Alphaproteobacteria bacterium]